MVPTRIPEDHVASVRAFNRFYTARIGVVRDGLLHTPHSLAEARVLFELGRREVTDVADLRRTLDLDAGYLSRLLTRLQGTGLVARERSRTDARRQRARLTADGHAARAVLDERSAAETRALLDGVPADDRDRLLEAMAVIRDVLDSTAATATPFALRPPRSGDLGWIVSRHGELYAREHGWDETFEGLVARVVADYAERHDPQRDAAWIAEAAGRRAGCVMCVGRSERVAQLRLLLVEPRARGLGIGAALVDACIDFARAAGHAQLRLWTNDVLEHARRIYERAGFALVSSEPHRSFGHDLVGQTWSRAL
jgi:DNA-binding MarR family transcriptional regulator/GNAT superfamily N-acetyltransferase